MGFPRFRFLVKSSVIVLFAFIFIFATRYSIILTLSHKQLKMRESDRKSSMFIFYLALKIYVF